MPALKEPPLSTGVEPESGVGPPAVSVQAVARAVPPLSLVTVLRRCSAGALSLLLIVQVTFSPSPTVIWLPFWLPPPVQTQLPPVYPGGPPVSESV